MHVGDGDAVKSNVAIYQEHEVIVCQSCGMRFVLFAVIYSTRYENSDEAVPQAICDYCPYCGARYDAAHPQLAEGTVTP